MTDPTPPPTVQLSLPPGSVLALRLLVRNRLLAAALIRPAVDDWVADDGRIFATGSRLDPAYIYVLQGGEGRQTLTLQVPADLRPGQVLQSSLRLPGVEETAVAIAIEIAAPAEGAKAPLVQHPLALDLPLGGEPAASAAPGGAAEATYGLVAGLASLDMVPARWLVAELVAAVCRLGAEQAETDEGAALLVRLGRTRFFKNGVLAFSAAQLPRWVGGSLSTASGLHAALGGELGQGRLLYIWERWLWRLVDTDVEAPGGGGVEPRVPPLAPGETVEALGSAADRWFGNLLLGLARVSPRVAEVLEAIAAQAPEPPPAPDDGAGPDDDVLGEGGSLGR